MPDVRCALARLYSGNFHFFCHTLGARFVLFIMTDAKSTPTDITRLGRATIAPAQEGDYNAAQAKLRGGVQTRCHKRLLGALSKVQVSTALVCIHTCRTTCLTYASKSHDSKTTTCDGPIYPAHGPRRQSFHLSESPQLETANFNSSIGISNETCICMDHRACGDYPA